jgi:hypothetical protein
MPSRLSVPETVYESKVAGVQMASSSEVTSRMRRSITPTRATTSLAASIDPTGAQRAGPPAKLAGGRDRPAAAQRDGYSHETKKPRRT